MPSANGWLVKRHKKYWGRFCLLRPFSIPGFDETFQPCFVSDARTTGLSGFLSDWTKRCLWVLSIGLWICFALYNLFDHLPFVLSIVLSKVSAISFQRLAPGGYRRPCAGGSARVHHFQIMDWVSVFSELCARCNLRARTTTSPVNLAPLPDLLIRHTAWGQGLNQPLRGRVAATSPS